MAFKVLIVDDSSFYRRRVKDILNADRSLEVVGEAKNGLEAIEKVNALKPDVVTMDVEMPLLDGIEAVKRIMSVNPLPIIMFSSLTHAGAKATLDALEAGAADFLPKKFEDIAKDRGDAAIILRTKVRMLARRAPVAALRKNSHFLTKHNDRHSTKVARPQRANAEPKQQFFRSSNFIGGGNRTEITNAQSHVFRSGKHYRCLAIGTSTGGPVALQKVLTTLPEAFAYPIFLVQHMPGAFTKAFADRLNQYCNIRVKEAEHGEVVKPGWAYLAPGGKQMEVTMYAQQVSIVITETDTAEFGYKPSVDITFNSISKVYGGETLAIILTGMGADGREGCKALKQLGAKVWAQDKATSVVYGMPQVVTADNTAELNIDIDHIGECINTEM